MNIIKLIIGLGNPYKKFYHTRHNVGMWYLRELASFFHVKFKKEKKFLGEFASIITNNYKIYLFQPEIFMNLSGSLVFNFSSYYKIKSSEILVVRDELDLCPGVLKFKYSSGHNGHNGMKSLISFFKKKNVFMQLCIGIGRPKFRSQIIDFVLSPPSIIEKRLIKQNIIQFIRQNSNFLENITPFFGKQFKIKNI